METVFMYLEKFRNTENYADRMFIKTEALENLNVAQSILFLNMCLDLVLAKIESYKK